MNDYVTDKIRPYYLPIFCNLNGKQVVVIGGGKVAFRKINLLLPTGANITVISPDVIKDIEQLEQDGKLKIKKRPFKKGDIKGTWLVIAATDDPQVQKTVFEEAESQRCFCNVVDKPEVCSFIVPSMVRRGDLCIAISTGGQSPGLSKHLRQGLEKEFGDEWEKFVAIIGELRKIVINKFPEDIRAEKLKKLLQFKCLDWIKGKKWDKIKKWAQDICEEKVTVLEKLLK